MLLSPPPPPSLRTPPRLLLLRLLGVKASSSSSPATAAALAEEEGEEEERGGRGGHSPLSIISTALSTGKSPQPSSPPRSLGSTCEGTTAFRVSAALWPRRNWILARVPGLTCGFFFKEEEKRVSFLSFFLFLSRSFAIFLPLPSAPTDSVSFEGSLPGGIEKRERRRAKTRGGREKKRKRS